MNNVIRYSIGFCSIAILIIASVLSYLKIIPLDTAIICMLPPAFIASIFLYASKGLNVTSRILFGLGIRAIAFMAAIGIAGSNINLTYDTIVLIIIICFIYFAASKLVKLKDNIILRYLKNNLSNTFYYFSLGSILSAIISIIYFHNVAVEINHYVDHKIGKYFPFFIAFCLLVIILGIIFAEYRMSARSSVKVYHQKFQGGATDFFNFMQAKYPYLKLCLLIIEKEQDLFNFISSSNKMQSNYDLIIINNFKLPQKNSMLEILKDRAGQLSAVIIVEDKKYKNKILHTLKRRCHRINCTK